METLGALISILSGIQNSGGMLGIMIYLVMELRILRRDFNHHILTEHTRRTDIL